MNLTPSRPERAPRRLAAPRPAAAVWRARHPRLRRALQAVGAACAAFALVVGISLGQAVAAPSTDPVDAKVASWMRVHGLGWAVTAGEQVLYRFDQPKVGGSASVPTIAASPEPSTGPSSAAPTPASSQVPGSAPLAVLQPAPLSTPDNAGPANEGRWQTLASANDKPTMKAAFVRPDRAHSSYLVSVVWMDQSQLRFKLHPGTVVPGGPFQEATSLQGDERAQVLATFNSGFQMVDANGGYWQDGTTVVPLREGAASMVFTTDGHVDIQRWAGGQPGAGIAAVRQNLTLLVDQGEITPDVQTASWGKTVGDEAYVWRSAIGVRRDGSLVSIVGPALTVQSLAEIAKHAGCQEAMELDINKDWTSFITYGQPGAVPHKLADDQVPRADRYLATSTRDFVAVTAR